MREHCVSGRVMNLAQFLFGLSLVLFASLFTTGGPWSAFLCLRQTVLGQRGCTPTGAIGNVTLHYFAERGRGEVIRLLLNEAGISYVETAFTKDTWPAAKETGLASGAYTFGQVPVLFTNSEQPLAQTQAIMKRLARASNMDCDCSDLSQCDAIALGTEDFRMQMYRVVYFEKFTNEARIAYLSGKAQTWFGYFEKLHQAGSTPDHHGYFGAKGHITWVDFLVFDTIDAHVDVGTKVEGADKYDVLAAFPKLRTFYSGFAKRPRIAAYLSSGRRPKLTLPSQVV